MVRAVTGLAQRLLGVLAVAVPVAAALAAGEKWDVTNTGQPYVDAAFTVTEGTWLSLDVSPDGRTIVFDLLGDIYTMPAGGGEARAILAGPAMQRSPVFSRDGRRLAFVSDASGSDNVWIADAEGRDARAVTHENVDLLTGPAWGPDSVERHVGTAASTSGAASRARRRGARRGDG